MAKDGRSTDRLPDRSWKVAPALACGCTIVMKPSEITPLTALVRIFPPEAPILLCKMFRQGVDEMCLRLCRWREG